MGFAPARRARLQSSVRRTGGETARDRPAWALVLLNRLKPSHLPGLCALSIIGLFLSAGPLERLASPIVPWFALGIVLGAVWSSRRLAEPDWLARRVRWLRPFGDAYYAPYLVHGIILTAAFKIWIAVPAVPSEWFLPFGFAAATAIGLLVHVFVETPLLRAGGRMPRSFRIGSSAERKA